MRKLFHSWVDCQHFTWKFKNGNWNLSFLATSPILKFILLYMYYLSSLCIYIYTLYMCSLSLYIHSIYIHIYTLCIFIYTPHTRCALYMYTICLWSHLLQIFSVRLPWMKPLDLVTRGLDKDLQLKKDHVAISLLKWTFPVDVWRFRSEKISCNQLMFPDVQILLHTSS